MDLLLNEEQVLLRDAAAKLGSSRGPRRARTLRDAGTEIDAAAWAEIIKAGWLSALVAEKDDVGAGGCGEARALQENGGLLGRRVGRDPGQMGSEKQAPGHVGSQGQQDGKKQHGHDPGRGTAFAVQGAWGVVPAHLPGKNPFLKEPTTMMKIPDDLIRAGAASMYPEFKAKLPQP